MPLSPTGPYPVKWTEYNPETGVLGKQHYSDKGFPHKAVDHYVIGMWDGREWYRNPDGLLVARPVTPQPTLAGNMLTCEGLPPETIIRVWAPDNASMETTAEKITTAGGLRLVDPGEYRLEVEPPFPWQSVRTFTVEVA